MARPELALEWVLGAGFPNFYFEKLEENRPIFAFFGQLSPPEILAFSFLEPIDRIQIQNLRPQMGVRRCQIGLKGESRRSAKPEIW